MSSYITSGSSNDIVQGLPDPWLAGLIVLCVSAAILLATTCLHKPYYIRWRKSSGSSISAYSSALASSCFYFFFLIIDQVLGSGVQVGNIFNICIGAFGLISDISMMLALAEFAQQKHKSTRALAALCSAVGIAQIGLLIRDLVIQVDAETGVSYTNSYDWAFASVSVGLVFYSLASITVLAIAVRYAQKTQYTWGNMSSVQNLPEVNSTQTYRFLMNLATTALLGHFVLFLADYAILLADYNGRLQISMFKVTVQYFIIAPMVSYLLVAVVLLLFMLISISALRTKANNETATQAPPYALHGPDEEQNTSAAYVV